MSDADPKPEGDPKATRGRCPICKSETHDRYRPFCSKRCADVDLGRWITGAYAIAGGDADSDEDGGETASESAEIDPVRR